MPNYPRLAQLRWQNIGDAVVGTKTPQEAVNALGAAQDAILERSERANVQGACGPKLSPRRPAEEWYKKAEADGTVAPQRKLADEKPRGQTVGYDALIKGWPATPPARG